jgi:hypothetical protein
VDYNPSNLTFGEVKMQVMNFGQSMQLSIEADDAQGVKQTLPVGATVTYVSDNPAAVAITMNPDGVTAVAKAVAPGPVIVNAGIIATLEFTDVLGSHKYQSPLDSIVVGPPPSTISGIKLLNGAVQ